MTVTTSVFSSTDIQSPPSLYKPIMRSSTGTSDCIGIHERESRSRDQKRLHKRILSVRVLAADEVPLTIRWRPRMYVVNTYQKRENNDTNWTAFYFPKQGPAEFFDSCGKAPEIYHRRFKKALIWNRPCYAHSNARVQSYDTKTCGQYYIYYLKLRDEAGAWSELCVSCGNWAFKY